MKTASHFSYNGEGRVVISLSAPRGAKAGYRIFRALAPKKEWMHSVPAIYIPRYRDEILAPLDPQQVWDKLHELAGGAEPVIQCFERPPFNTKNWCHRRLVSQWFKQTLGHDVPEIGYDGPDFVSL